MHPVERQGIVGERIAPPTVGTEREVLRGHLEFRRATLAMTCAVLDDDALRRRSCPPSTLSLLGLVRHMAEVERAWFRCTIAGEDLPLVWSDDGDFHRAHDPRAARRRSRPGRPRSSTRGGSTAQRTRWT